MDESHFIPLHSAVKLKKLFSVRKQFFETLSLCCVSFFPLDKILLVSRIQTAFARRKRSGYARLGKVDCQRPVRAAKNIFGSYPVWKTSLFTERLLSMPQAFAFCLLFPKRKAFADIHRNVGLVRSVMIRQRKSSNCNKPVTTWPLWHLANLSPWGASCPRVIN